MLRPPAALAVLSLALAACDALLGIEPWASEPEGTGGSAEGGGGATTSSAGGTATSTGEGGAGCEGGLERCGAECVELDTDSRHCGACDRSCFGGSCSEGACGIAELGSEGFVGVAQIAATVASGQSPGWIVWTAPNGTLRGRPKPDGAPSTLVTGLNGIRTLDANVGGVVLSDVPDGNGVARVHRLDPGQGAPRIVGEGAAANASSIALDGATVFLSGGADQASQGVYSLPSNGVAATPALVCANGANVTGADLALSASFVYYRRTSGGGNAMVCAKSGGSAAPVNATQVSALATDGALVYYAVASTIYARPFPMQGESVHLVSPDPVSTLVATATHLAWRSGTKVYLAENLQGATPVVVADEASTVTDVALDVDGLYWITNQGLARALAF